jgi:hypothetical protein
MAERETTELAAHLSCLLTTAQATIEKVMQLHKSGGGPGIATLVSCPAFRGLVDDVANANLWLAQQARRTDAVALAQADGLVITPGTTLFPRPPGLPDVGR